MKVVYQYSLLEKCSEEKRGFLDSRDEAEVLPNLE